jgi:hypothetical protein
LQGETETQVLAFASEHQEDIEASIVRPGLITAPGEIKRNLMAFAVKTIISAPTISVAEVAAAMLDQAVSGIEKDTLDNGDLVRIGQRALAEP